ncbi:glycoside hydrolase family 99-like domain-containing protein [Bradyrhizobium symbiodeficiens]|uniref:glycoside hydrolase family 99-like domain-containing protein n=1 Tax=Bradyrhizobium symbiodeficiens TaxID=1404367 RepID=UPI00140F7841|nr:glycoside hydrolase family 99-like domain-containing protein [Bradyrhizobium symbiodeficiens]QIO98808.1 hypothetical protein HAU86_02835 [Bradyrhizobium symbiodeficiens]
MNYHRQSSIAGDVNYCLIVTLDTLGRANSFEEAIQAIHSLFSDRNYQRTKDGRPVLFLYYLDGLLPGFWRSSLENLGKALAALRQKVTTSGDQNPYIILLYGPPTTAESIRARIGADAISTYGINFGPNRSASYKALAKFVESYWADELQATSATVVPTVMIGWDSRPRKENPPAYDKRDYSQISKSAFISLATPQDFQDACRQALDFMRSHEDRCPYSLALIYAWNEYSEGGALGPTLGDPSASVLRAAGEVFKSCHARGG